MSYSCGLVDMSEGFALAINGVSDHVHILGKLRPDKAVSSVVRDLKANSSGWMHDVFPAMKDFSWQNGYGAFTVSSSQIGAVSDYIAKQEPHHSGRTFRDEFAALLRRNGVEFDERYLFV